jgi:hypothetical protein
MSRLASSLSFVFCVVFSLALTVILGAFLAAISLMFIDDGRSTDPRIFDSSSLRQIGQASLIFSFDNNDQLPNATDLPDYARQLAIGGGLNDASVWVRWGTTIPGEETVILRENGNNPVQRPLNPAFVKLPYLFAVPLNGITTKMPPTTPIGWTRGLDLETGKWNPISPYAGDGGYVLFLGGNVQFFRDLSSNGGELRRFADGKPTASIRDALPPGTRISDNNWYHSSRVIPKRIPDLIRAAIMLSWPVWMLALFPTLTLLLHRRDAPTPFKVPRFLKLALFATPVLLLTLSVIFRV